MKPFFVRHEPCPSCGSRDNLARYSDGAAFCFGGCGHIERPDPTKWSSVSPSSGTRPPPKDLTDTLPNGNKLWLKQYLTEEEIHRYFKYSPYFDRHICIFGDFWEGRSVNQKPKTLSFGSKPFLLLETPASKQDVVVVVEDIVSAIVVSRVAKAYPLFGAYLSGDNMVQLVKEPGVKKVIVWLDYNKAIVAQKYADKLNLLRPNLASTIATISDPKDLETEFITKMIGTV